jgi:uncharacterized protein
VLHREKGFIFNHGKRVGRLAVHLRERISPGDDSQDEVVYVGGLFHDFGKDIRPHHETGAVLVGMFLKDYATAEEIQAVAEVVRMHNQRETRDHRSTPVKLVQDADVLDHLGTMEVWLKFFFDAHAEHGPDQALEYWHGGMYQEHREKIRPLLNFEVSKEIFDERIRFEDVFIQRFTVESQGGIV